MKKLAFAVLIVGAVFALSQCELFNTTVEYNVSGFSSPLSIMYQDENGELVEVSASAPWSTTFDLFSSDRPFLAFIRVDNYGASDVSVYILEDTSYAAGPSTATASGGSTEIYAVIY